MIFHLATVSDWEKALNSGWYFPASGEGIWCFMALDAALNYAATCFPDADKAVLLHIVEKRLKKFPLDTDGWPEGTGIISGRIGLESVDRTDMMLRQANGIWSLA